MKYFLAIDLGTSNCRSAIYDENLEMLDITSMKYPLINISSVQIEQDALLWWHAVKQTIRELVAKSDDYGQNIRSIAISSQGISLLPIDKDATPLMYAISWLDTRAQNEEALLEAQYGKTSIFKITGKRANACYTLPKLMWLKSNKSTIYDRADKMLLPLDFIQYKLCGKTVTDHTMAGGTMFYDIHSQQWASDILADQGIDIAKLPEIAWSGSVLGTILPNVAQELGLNGDIIITVGGQDQKCAALGAGVSAESATVSLGTASCITQLAAKPVLDPRLRIPCFSYLWPQTWSFEGIINTAAASYQWFKDHFAPQLSYQQMEKFAANVAQSGQRAFFFPYLAGMTSPFWGNGSGSFSGLSLSSDIGQFALAILDGVACNIKANLNVMQSIYQPIGEVRLFGGGTASPLWCQIVSDVVNLPVVTQRSPETALLGAAMLAKYGYDGNQPLTQKAAKIYYPNPKNVKVYAEYYAAYNELLKKQFEYNE